MGLDSYVLLWNVWSEVEKHHSFFFLSLSLDLSNYEWGYWQAEGKYDDSSRCWFSLRLLSGDGKYLNNFWCQYIIF